jgi:SAM-dependent methyltransferase
MSTYTDTPYQLFPALDRATEDALRESIGRWGVIVPIVVDQDGQVIDGHHRQRIANALGVDYGVQQIEVGSEDDARAIAATLNTDRRHMDIDQRRAIVAHLREQGHSLRAIAGAVGVDDKTVRRDIAAADMSAPQTVRGADGKTYPATRPAREVELGDTVIDDDGQERLVDLVEHLVIIHDDDGDAITLDPDAEVVVDSKPFVLSKPDLDGTGLSHPARYPNALIPILASTVPVDQFPKVLDPFAGTGRIHQLPNETIGVEIEPEWAALHDDTICASALELPFDNDSFDAIVTSPTYGNRLADAGYSATPDRRHSYTFDLGRKLNDENSGGMYWGGRYRTFHETAWAEADRVLRSGGRFVLNIKDHIKLHERQFVTGWHVTHLMQTYGYSLLWCEDLNTSGLPTVDGKLSLPEQIFVLEKP